MLDSSYFVVNVENLARLENGYNQRCVFLKLRDDDSGVHSPAARRDAAPSPSRTCLVAHSGEKNLRGPTCA
jgi:hypothetical protein